ncbi:glycosyl hydrolase (family 43) [Skeletonema marinoi]|uniref:Glycosyl hydrolase (Family 43) n=1 Tax=Skeletonema marinoi TaxID=267567 RepID=A0AAD8YJK3_9STRA|nr:glycosyl hydrolase (family 43) [Skeletonema marinoi]
MHINELTSNYTSFTGKWKPIFQGRYMEAPTIFQRGEKYYFIGSGCTAWKPNAARSAVSTSVWGPWTELRNPCRGEDADTTFHSQSTYVLPISDGKVVRNVSCLLQTAGMKRIYRIRGMFGCLLSLVLRKMKVMEVKKAPRFIGRMGGTYPRHGIKSVQLLYIEWNNQ